MYRACSPIELVGAHLEESIAEDSWKHIPPKGRKENHRLKHTLGGGNVSSQKGITKSKSFLARGSVFFQ